MNTRQYYYLATIAEAGNLTRAAEVLQVSPSALSKFLSECEKLFDSPLFLRYNRRLYPTAVGRQVVDYAQKILDEQTRMLLTMKEVSGCSLRIRLATAPNRAAIIYSKIYRPFSRRYPDIALSLTELFATDQPGAIARGQIDMALGAGVPTPHTVDIPVAYEELLIALPAAHPLAGQDVIRLTDLQDTPFVLQGKRHSIRILAEQLFQQAGFQPVVAFESEDVLLVDSMLHQAVGVGFVSQVHITPCPELVYRPLDPPVQQTLHLRYPKGHQLTDPERYLAALLIEERLADPRYIPVDSPFVQTLRTEAFPEKNPAQSPAFTGQSDIGPSSLVPEVYLDTKVLEYLAAIVEEQSLAQAADRFFLAQPALSRYLRSVEKALGMTLFSREHNRLRPTAAGMVFANNSRNILRLEKDLLDWTHSYQKGRGGRLYLSCDPLLANLVHEKVEPSFHSLHPELSLVISQQDQNDTLHSLYNASADMGILLSTDPVFPLLHCQVLTLTELVYCFSQNDLPNNWCSGDTIPSDFHPKAQLLLSRGSTLRKEQEKALTEQFGILPPTACEADLSVLGPLSRLGLMDAVLPLHLLDEPRRSTCAAFDPPRPLYLLLAHHAGRTPPPAARDLQDLVLEMLQDAFVQLGKSDGSSL